MTFLESLKFSLQVTGFFIVVLAAISAWGFVAHWIIGTASLWVSIPALIALTVLTTATVGWLFTKDS